MQAKAADDIAIIMRTMESEIIEIMGLVIGSGKYYDLGTIERDIRARIPYYSGYIKRTVSQVYKKTADKAIAFGDERALTAGIAFGLLWDNPQARNIYNRAVDETVTILTKILLTAAPATESVFRNTITEGFYKVKQGANVDQVAAWTAAKAARQGVAYVAYGSGRIDHIDVAARRSVLSSLNQYFGQIAYARYEELGAPLVETSAHMGAREEHAHWQGRRFGFKGDTTIDGVFYPDFVRSTGYGTMLGLLGINCRHSFYPVFDASSPLVYSKNELATINDNAVIYNGKSIPQYKAEQHQRAQERAIRATKRQLVCARAAIDAGGGAALQGQYRQLRAVLAGQNASYKAFATGTGLPVYSERLRITKKLNSAA